jgi:hypothetical protein
MTVEEAAQRKQVTCQAIAEAIWRGTLNARRFGRMWDVIEDEAFANYKPRYPRGGRRKRNVESEEK